MRAVAFVAVLAASCAFGAHKIGFVVQIPGARQDSVAGMVRDAEGNLIVAGTTTSHDFPATAGQRRRDAGDGLADSDVFVMKYSARGELLWSTLLGGDGSDSADAVAVDAQGGIYVAGTSGSANFPLHRGTLWRLFRLAAWRVRREAVLGRRVEYGDSARVRFRLPDGAQDHGAMLLQIATHGEFSRPVSIHLR